MLETSKINPRRRMFFHDLVFYNRLLRCFVIIDLKIGKVYHQDIGQILPKDNKTIFSSEYKLHMLTELELITAIEEEKKNLELNE